MIAQPAIAEQTLYSDFSKLTELKKGAREQSPEAIRQVAKQFESLFVQMMLKSMRDTLPENELFGSQSERMYQDMYDKQLSLNMSNGQGIGLLDVIERQLGGVPKQDRLEQPFAAYKSSPRPSVSHHSNVVPERDTGQQSAVKLSTLVKPATETFVLPHSTAPEAAEIDQGWDSPEAFIDEVWPYAQQAAKQLGIDPDVLVAQSALETGWGKYVPLREDGSNSYNLFGIKADHRWQGERVEISTREYRHGVMQHEKASFRAYDSIGSAFEDYTQFILSSPRYQKALEHGYDAKAYAQELQRAGYATDPDYAKKINRIRNGDTLDNKLSELKKPQEVPLT